MQRNARLEPLAAFIGEWRTEGTHPLVPGRTFHGHASYSWHESGAFILARTRIEEPEIPDGVYVIGTDDGSAGGSMLYYDVRGVSREYRWTLEDNVWRWSRITPEFSQRMRLELAADGKTIASRGEMSRDGGAWEADLQLTYTRA